MAALASSRLPTIGIASGINSNRPKEGNNKYSRPVIDTMYTAHRGQPVSESGVIGVRFFSISDNGYLLMAVVHRTVFILIFKFNR